MLCSFWVYIKVLSDTYTTFLDSFPIWAITEHYVEPCTPLLGLRS